MANLVQKFDYTMMVENSNKKSLADVLTYCHCEKMPKKGEKPTPLIERNILDEAFLLFFDRAYKRI